MANKGTLEGHQLISEQTWNEFHSEITVKPELNMMLGKRLAFSKGGVAAYHQDLIQSTPKFEQFSGKITE